MRKAGFLIFLAFLLIVPSACRASNGGEALVRTLPDGSTLSVLPASPRIGDRVCIRLVRPRRASRDEPVLGDSTGAALSPTLREEGASSTLFEWRFRVRLPGDRILLGDDTVLFTVPSARLDAVGPDGLATDDPQWLWSGKR